MMDSQSRNFSLLISRETVNCTQYIDNLYLKDIDSLYILDVVLLVINCFTAITAISGNSLVIWAILRTSSLHNPSNILLCCLGMTDLLTGLISQPLLIAYTVNRINGNYPAYCDIAKFQLIPGYVLSGASFLTLSVISIDRFLAVNLHLRYREFVTIRRVLMAEAAVSCAAIILAVVRLVADSGVSRPVMIASLSLNIAINVALYISILRTVRKHERIIHARQQLAEHLHSHDGLDLKKCKKTSGTMAVIFVAFCIFYLPYLCILVVSASLKSNVISWEVNIGVEASSTIVLCNATLNPLLYCMRVNDIRRAVLAIFRRDEE